MYLNVRFVKRAGAATAAAAAAAAVTWSEPAPTTAVTMWVAPTASASVVKRVAPSLAMAAVNSTCRRVCVEGRAVVTVFVCSGTKRASRRGSNDGVKKNNCTWTTYQFGAGNSRGGDAFGRSGGGRGGRRRGGQRIGRTADGALRVPLGVA